MPNLRDPSWEPRRVYSLPDGTLETEDGHTVTIPPGDLPPSVVNVSPGAAGNELASTGSAWAAGPPSVINVQTSYNALCDGTGAALSTRFGSLAAAQAVYPSVTSLAQSIDFAAMQTLINALGTTGGDIFVPGHAVISDQLTFPFDATSPVAFGPRHIRIFGLGGMADGRWTGSTPAGASTLDLQYAGAGVAKIDTRGRGVLELDHLALVSGGADDVPFIQTTNTTVRIHDCAVYGHAANSGTACVQDFLLGGGTGTTEYDMTAAGSFQGYGSVIKDNYFFNIRRIVYGRDAFNGNTITENTVSTSCGNSAGGCIEVVGGSSGHTCTGNVIQNNTVEVSNYQYAVRLSNATMNTIRDNGWYDPTATHLAGVLFDAGARYNDYTIGYADDTHVAFLEDVSVADTNTVHTSHQSQTTYLPQPHRFSGKVVFSGRSGAGPSTYSFGGSDAHIRVNDGSGAPNPAPAFVVCVTPPTQVTDGVTQVSGVLNRVSSATANWTSADVGAPISNTNIPNDTYIQQVLSTTDVLLTRNCTGAPATAQTFTFGRAGTEQQMTQFTRHHIVSTGNAPGAGADQPGAGSGASISVVGTDLAGTITLTTGTPTVPGNQLCHLAAALGFTAAPRCSLEPKNNAAAALRAGGNAWWTTGPSNPLLALQTSASAVVPASTAFIWDYELIQ